MPVKNEARYAAVAEMHAQGMNDVQIGARLGLTKSAILYFRRHLGLPAIAPGSRAVLVTEAQLREWSAAGMTKKQMSERCTASPHTISRKLWEIRLKDERAAALNSSVEDVFNGENDDEPVPEIVGDELFLAAFKEVRVALPTNSRRAETSNRDGRIYGLPPVYPSASSIYGA